MTTWLGAPDAPADECVAITASDSTVFAATRALYVGTGGDVAVMPAAPGSVSVVFQNVPSGAVLPIRITQVLVTGTSGAGDFVALR